MHPYRVDFERYQKVSGQYVEMGDGTRVAVAGRGTVVYKIGGYQVRIKDVLHVPELDVALLAILLH
jgi:hypothetical protein